MIMDIHLGLCFVVQQNSHVGEGMVPSLDCRHAAAAVLANLKLRHSYHSLIELACNRADSPQGHKQSVSAACWWRKKLLQPKLTRTF